MEFLAELWLPIVLSAVFVFVASSILHMVIPIHKGDYKKLANEEKVLAAMREQGVEPGQYCFPCPASMKDMCTPEMIEKYNLGPCGMMTVMPTGVPKMGKSLILWFLYSVILSIFVAYITRLTVVPGESYLRVFRIAGTVAVVGYAVSYIPDSIWKGQSWSSTFKFIFDGVIYGLVTAGTFGWLWPDAM